MFSSVLAFQGSSQHLQHSDSRVHSWHSKRFLLTHFGSECHQLQSVDPHGRALKAATRPAAHGQIFLIGASNSPAARGSCRHGVLPGRPNWVPFFVTMRRLEHV